MSRMGIHTEQRTDIPFRSPNPFRSSYRSHGTSPPVAYLLLQRTTVCAAGWWWWPRAAPLWNIGASQWWWRFLFVCRVFNETCFLCTYAASSHRILCYILLNTPPIGPIKFRQSPLEKTDENILNQSPLPPPPHLILLAEFSAGHLSQTTLVWRLII